MHSKKLFLLLIVVRRCFLGAVWLGRLKVSRRERLVQLGNILQISLVRVFQNQRPPFPFADEIVEDEFPLMVGRDA